MHILFAVHQFFPNGYFGTERLVLNICKQMQRCGHRVTVLTYCNNEPYGYVNEGKFLKKEYTYQGVSVISIRHKVIPDLLDFSIFDEDMIAYLNVVFAEDSFDLVHVYHPMRIGSVIPFAHIKGIPIIITLTDFWLICPRGIAITRDGSLCIGSRDGIKCSQHCYQAPNWKRELLQTRIHQVKMIFEYTNTIISGTRFLKMMFENTGLCHDIKVIPFGKEYRGSIKNTNFYDENSKITIGYLSSLTPHKGAHILLEAYQKINPKNIHLKIYGDCLLCPEYSVILKKIANESPNIEFCGKYDYEMMPEMLKNIDIVAVPSLWWENSPLVLLRALMHNVPIIASNMGGLNEVVKDGENGLIFSVIDSEASKTKSQKLSDIIWKISENPKILNDLKSRIHHPQRIEEMVFSYENIYERVIDGSVQTKENDSQIPNTQY
jgi:glycosyltransferase involved in cell wall biosynthesis